MVWVVRPFSSGIWFVLFWDDGGVSLPHGLDVDRLLDVLIFLDLRIPVRSVHIIVGTVSQLRHLILWTPC